MADIDISFIIPAFNEEEYIASVLSTIKNVINNFEYEILVVDNGSNDNTATLASRYADEVVSIERTSISLARNIGVEHSRGKVLVFLDADVRLTDEWAAELEKCYKDILQEHIITGARYVIRETPSFIERNWFGPLSKKPVGYINGGNILLSAKTFSLIGGFNVNYETGEDVEFCRMAEEKNIAICPNSGFKAIHDGYPRNIKDFIKREIWHGKGDYADVNVFIRSLVAMVATFNAILIYISIVFVLFAPLKYALITFLITILISFLISANLFLRKSIMLAFVNFPLCYLYVFSRHISFYSHMFGRL